MSLLSCTKSETEHILKQLQAFRAGDDSTPLSEHRFVTFNEQQMTITSFLSCFEYPIHLHESQSDSPNASLEATTSEAPTTNMPVVSQIKKITDDKKSSLSKYVVFQLKYSLGCG